MPTNQHKAASHSELSAAIRRLAVARGAGGKLPTVRELSQQFAQPVREIDKALLPLEWRGLVQRKHGSGIYVLPAVRQKTVGVVLGYDIFSPGFSPYWSLLLQAIREQTAGGDVRPRAYLDFAGGREGFGDHYQLTEDLQAERLDALLLIVAPIGWDESEFTRSLSIPLVTLDSRDKGWVACFDERALLRQAARAVVASGSAHSVALLSCVPDRERFENELRRVGYDGASVVDWSYAHWASLIPEVGNQESCARKLVARAMSAEESEGLPDMIVSTEDTMTRGAVTALQGAGIRIGRDVRIVTAENRGSPVLDPYSDLLTRIVLDPAELIRAALGMLEILMDGGTPPQRMVLIEPQTVAPSMDGAKAVPDARAQAPGTQEVG